MMSTITATSSRILLDIPCKVCQDHSSGKHYGIYACDGCAGFFKRSIRRNRQYVCKARSTPQEGRCPVDKTHRNQCRACRLQTCLKVGMNRDAVQHERGPRNSTLRRQMALYFKENGGGGKSPPSSVVSGNSPVSLPFVTKHSSALFSGSPLSQTSNAGSIQNSLPFPILGSFPAPLPKLPNLNFPPFLAPPPLAGSMLPMPGMLFPLGWFPPHFLGVESRMPPSCLSNNSFQTELTETASTPPPIVMITPKTVKTENQSESVKELAARLLFMSVNWPKSIPHFASLSEADQLVFIKNAWHEIFLLTAVQLNFLSDDVAKCLVDESGCNASDVQRLKELLAQFQHLQPAPDAMEFACLRGILLFGSIAGMSEQMQLQLAAYEKLQHPSDPFRGVKLLLLLPMLKNVPETLVERVFFSDVTGNEGTSMGRLVCDLFLSKDEHFTTLK